MIMTKQNWFKRSMAVLLVLIMCLGIVPTSVFAADEQLQNTRDIYLSALNEARNISESDYSKSSYTVFQKRIDEYDRSASMNDDYETLTDYEYSKLTQGIKEAYSLLREPSHTYYQEFAKLIDYCDSINPDNYTDESYTEFSKQYEKLKKRYGLKKADAYVEKDNDVGIYQDLIVNRYYSCLNLLVSKDCKEVIKEDESTGLRLISDSDTISEDTVLTVDKFDSSNWDWQNVQSIYLTNIETVCNQYEYYSFSLLDNEGNRVKFSKSFSIELPVPDYFDIDSLTVSLYKNSCAAGAIGGISVDNEKRVVTVTFPDGSWLYTANGAAILLKNPVSSVDPLTLENDGVYQIQADLTKYTDAAEASMANAALVNEAYLTKNGENIDVYLNFNPIYILADTPAYCGGLWCEKGEIKDGEYFTESKTVFSYYTNEDGSIRDNDIYNGITEINCPKTIKLHLERDSYNDFGGYTLAVSSPTMAAAFDTPFEEMYMDDLLCNLFISKPELIDTIDNADKYLPTYDKSALRYEIDYSKSLDELDYTVESWRNLIDTVDIAQVKYDGDSITTEEITEQIGLVQAARKALVIDDSADGDKAELEKLVAEAEKLNEDDYTKSSYSALQDALTAAKKVLDKEHAKQPRIDTVKEKLQAAIDALVKKPENTLDKDNLEDGKYILSAEMFKIDRSSYSMANNAINHTVWLEVVNGEYYLTVQFEGLAIYNKFGYLSKLSYYNAGYTYSDYGIPQGERTAATVLSTQKDSDGKDVIDQYNDANNLYPELLKIKLVDKASQQYVPLHVFVPIMEAIAEGTGDQDVVMELDWSTLVENKDGKIDKEEQEEQSPAVDITDGATGVKVHADKGVFEEGVKLVVTEITKGADYDLAASALDEVGKKFKLYEIHFEDANGNEVQPNGTVTVSYPIPAGYDAANVVLYRINEDGSKTLIKGAVDGNYYTVITKSFSNYALVEKDSTITDDQNTQNVNNGNSGNSGSPQTGDNRNIMLWFMLALASAGMICVLTFTRKRRVSEGE